MVETAYLFVVGPVFPSAVMDVAISYRGFGRGWALIRKIFLSMVSQLMANAEETSRV